MIVKIQNKIKLGYEKIFRGYTKVWKIVMWLLFSAILGTIASFIPGIARNRNIDIWHIGLYNTLNNTLNIVFLVIVFLALIFLGLSIIYRYQLLKIFAGVLLALAFICIVQGVVFILLNIL